MSAEIKIDLAGIIRQIHAKADRQQEEIEQLKHQVTELKEGFDWVSRRVAALGCYDCGRRYGHEHGFPDMLVPDEVWNKISPTGDEGGLLCPSCICKRVADAGIECRAVFVSGPFCEE